jgi:predicted peroxiredoxin
MGGETRLGEKRKIVYVQLSGVNTPGRVYASLMLATTASATGIDTTVYFLLDGVTLMKRGEAERIAIKGFPPLKEVIDQAVAAGVTLEACEQSCQLLGLGKADLLDAVKIVGSATLNDRAFEADAVLSF